MALYHDMRVHEDFHQCGQRLFAITKEAQDARPGAKRILFLDIQGHRNVAGGFDPDAYEILAHFIPDVLMPHLSEVHTPLLHVRNPKEQNNDLPDLLLIEDPEGRSSSFVRDEDPDRRKTKPTLRAIMNYLGLEEPQCMICWQAPVERAHARPAALGGSNDVRNFALLCVHHHRLAPDVPDSNAFWRWVDRMLTLDGPFSEPTPTTASGDTPFYDAVREELSDLYGWRDEEIDRLPWSDVMREYWRIISATGSHFGIQRKVSTHAWALDQALQRITMGGRAIW